MRAVRLIIVLFVVSTIFMLALGESRLARQPFAQIPAAPGPVPLTPPVAPGQPRPFSTIGALPSLVPAPGSSLALAPTAQPTPRVFRCTCSAPGTWTEWAGLVTSSSFILPPQSPPGPFPQYFPNPTPPPPLL